MKLTSIRVESFKKFRDPFTLSGLVEGVNIFSGPNGAGKSTVAEAVRAAFLERSRSSEPAKLLAPHTQPGSSPNVQIEFTSAGKTYRVSKSFGPKKHCEFVEDGRLESGEAAERRLAELFSFTYAGKGASNPSVQGIPGLLWVRQGAAGEIAAPAGSAHEYLRRALGEDLSELAATAGDRLIQTVKAQLHDLQTPTGKPTGALQSAIEEQQKLAADVAELDQQIAKYAATVDEFGALRRKLNEGERIKPWVEMELKAEAAREAIRRLSQLQQERAQALARKETAEANVQRCASAVAALLAEEEQAAQRKVALDAAIEDDGRTHAAALRASSELKQAGDADEAARKVSAIARRVAERQRLTEWLQSARQQQEQLSALEEQVSELQVQLDEARADESRLKPFKDAHKKATDLHSKATSAQARLEAVATRIEYAFDVTGVTIDGESLTGRGQVTITEATWIEIAGIGKLQISPGASDLVALRAELERHKEALRSFLESLGVASVQDVADHERKLQEASLSVKSCTETINKLVPKGMSELRRQKMELEGGIQSQAEKVESLSMQDDPGIGVAEAEAKEQETEQRLRIAQEQENHARHAGATARARRVAAQEEFDRAQAVLAVPGREERKQKLHQELLAAHQAATNEHVTIGALDDQLLQANLPQLEQNAVRFESSARLTLDAHRRLRNDVVQLEGELRALGAYGHQESVAEKREQLARVERRLADKRRTARALAHLLKVLEEQRAELARSIREPLQLRLNHYLGIQFPGVSIQLDERLVPSAITRQGLHGTETAAFEEMSGGEREQLGIIARFAYADLLKQAGKPTLIVLDDSLVNTDTDRLASMKRVIYDAGLRHQIIIFTCHEQHWLDLGTAPRRLQ